MDINADKKWFKSGHLTEEAIACYAETLKKENSSDLPVPVLEHVESCINCKQQILNTISLLNEASVIKSIDRTSGNTKNLKLFLRIAAAIIVFGSLSLIFILKPDTEIIEDNHTQIALIDTIINDSVAKQNSDSEKLKVEEENAIDEDSKLVELLANNYTESTVFETLMQVEYRNVLNIKIRSPKNNQSYNSGNSIIFNWEEKIEDQIMLKIFNNTYFEPIITYRIVSSPFTMSNKLKKGLYYWKLETEEELLYVGKFIIN